MTRAYKEYTWLKLKQEYRLISPSLQVKKKGEREEGYEHFRLLIGKEYKSSQKTGRMYV